LELVSKNSGLRLPQLTTEERDNVATQWKAPNADPDVVKAAEGLVIYNKTNNCLEFWNNEDWISLCAESSRTLNASVFAAPTNFATGTISGKYCFDVDMTSCNGVTVASRTPYKTNFANRSIQTSTSQPNPTFSGVQTYTFTAGGNVSNVRYWIDVTQGSLAAVDVIDTQTTPLKGTLEAGTLQSDSSVDLIIYFKNDLNSKLQGTDRDSGAKITLYFIYYNGSKDVAVPANISIQDCTCCGAKISGNVWQEFMCYNLGVKDQTADPFTPAQNLHGAKYKAGMKDPALDADQDATASNDGGFATATWSTMGVNTIANPCPAGYVVPTSTDWTNVAANNTWTVVGATTWTSSWFNGRRVGDYLFLPATGYRQQGEGALYDRGISGYYWASDTQGGQYYRMSFGDGTTSNNGIFTTQRINANVAYSVRCIAQ